jgi:hypothetical protein
MAMVSIDSGLSAPSSRTQAEIAGSAVSIAKILMRQNSSHAERPAEAAHKRGADGSN